MDNFYTDFKYTSRDDKPSYVFKKYKDILVGNILDVGADKCGLKKLLPENTKYTSVGLGGYVDIDIDLEKERLPFKDDEFDCVLCLDVLEHLDNIHDVFDELCRVTKKHLIISLPNPWRSFFYLILKGEKYNPPSDCLKFYNLPIDKPEDRHKWFYGIREAEIFLSERGKKNNMEIIQMDREKTQRNAVKLLKKILPVVIHKDIKPTDLLDGTLWVVLRKNI